MVEIYEKPQEIDPIPQEDIDLPPAKKKGADYNKLIQMAAERLDDVHIQANMNMWAQLRSIYEAVESVVAEYTNIKRERRRGRPPAGKEGFTIVKIYKDIAKQSKFWAYQTIKNFHLTYEEVYQRLESHDVIQSIETSPSTIEAVVLAKIPDKDKDRIFKKAIKKVMTRQTVRAEVRKIQEGSSVSGIPLFSTTLWKVRDFDPRFGTEGIPGRTPGQLIYNLFYHFVDEGAKCYFPFFGSGTEGDVAKEFGCDYEAWDIEHYEAVAEKHGDKYYQFNSAHKWRVGANSGDFIFMDPPRVFYESGEFDDGITNLNEVNYENYVGALALAVNNGIKCLRVGGRLAIMLRHPYASEVPQEDLMMYMHTKHLIKNLDFVRRIIVTWPRNIFEPKEKGKLGDGYLDLVIYEKH